MTDDEFDMDRWFPEKDRTATWELYAAIMERKCRSRDLELASYSFDELMEEHRD